MNAEEEEDDIVRNETLPDIKDGKEPHRLGRSRKTPGSIDTLSQQQNISMSVDVGKLYIKTSIDNNTADNKMLRYHDFELVAMYPLPQVSQSQNLYKQAYLKYQSERHGRQHSIPSSSKFGGNISDVSPSRFTMVRSQRGAKKGNISLSTVGRVAGAKNPHSVLLSNKHLSKLPPNMQIPEYKKNEYIRRDFSPYIKRFLQNQ